MCCLVCVDLNERISCLSFLLVPSWSSNTPLYPRNVASKGACPDSLFFHYFQFKLSFESIKELGSMSSNNHLHSHRMQVLLTIEDAHASSKVQTFGFRSSFSIMSLTLAFQTLVTMTICLPRPQNRTRELLLDPVDA